MNSKLISRRNLIVVVAAFVLVIAAAFFWRMRGGFGSAADFVEYPMTVANDIPTAVAAGTDNTIWFTIGFADAVGMIRNQQRHTRQRVGERVDVECRLAAETVQ